MAAPKSVTKVYTSKSKYGQVEYTDNVDRVNYTIEELTKAALRDVGKVLIPRIKEKAPKRSGKLSKAWQKWVKKDKGFGQMELDLGVYSMSQAKKKNQKFVHYAHMVIMGHATRNGGFVAGNNFLYQTVQENIDLIRETEGKYLSAIEDENEALRIAAAEEGKAEDA